MLKYRILTASILIPLVVLGIYSLPKQWYALVTAGIILLAAWEWSRLIGLQSGLLRIFYIFFISWFVLGAMLIDAHYSLYIGLSGWCIASVWVINYAKSRQFPGGNSLLMQGIMGAVVLVPCWVALNVIRGWPQGPSLLMLMLMIIWAADIGAYFAGRRWGKHKLAPTISPGKTIEGMAGGIIAALVIAFIGATLFNITMLHGAVLFGLTCITVVVSVIGDLYESLLKRQQGLKDSGHMLPGHGGILDRIDSLTAAAPVFALGIVLLGMV